MQDSYPERPGFGSDAASGGGADDGALVVRLVGEFDSHSERMFLGCIRELLCEGYGLVEFDFSGVQFADTAGLRCLFQAQRLFRRVGRPLLLTGLPTGLDRILQMVSAQGLAAAVEDSESAAMHAPRSHPLL
jgi:anti-anti-sigma factor